MSTTPIQLLGKPRTSQRAIWDSFTVAAGAALLKTTTILFQTNVVNQSSITGDQCNMRSKGALPTGHQHIVKAIRVEMIGAAADLDSMLQYTWLNFKLGGPVVWENTLSLASGGVGVPNAPANGIADQRSIYYFDTDPIVITGQTSIELDVITGGAAANATAAFFFRAYLDGQYTELV